METSADAIVLPSHWYVSLCLVNKFSVAMIGYVLNDPTKNLFSNIITPWQANAHRNTGLCEGGSAPQKIHFLATLKFTLNLA